MTHKFEFGDKVQRMSHFTMNNKYLTASTVTLFDAEIHPPPKGAVLLILSKYNVLTKGTFQQGFHVAWGYLPKTPASVKRRMAE